MRKLSSTLILALLFALSGCKTVTPEQAIEKQCDDNRSAIEKHIADAGKKAAMLAVVDSFETEIRSIASDSEKARKDYDAALRSYDATDAQLEQLQQDVASCLTRLCEAAKTHSLELRKQCSAEEWDKITAHYHGLKEVSF